MRGRSEVAEKVPSLASVPVGLVSSAVSLSLLACCQSKVMLRDLQIMRLKRAHKNSQQNSRYLYSRYYKRSHGVWILHARIHVFKQSETTLKYSQPLAFTSQNSVNAEHTDTKCTNIHKSSQKSKGENTLHDLFENPRIFKFS